MPKAEPILSESEVKRISAKDMNLHVLYWEPMLCGEKQTLSKLRKQAQQVRNRLYAKNKRAAERGVLQQLEALVQSQQSTIEDLTSRQLSLEIKLKCLESHVRPFGKASYESPELFDICTLPPPPLVSNSTHEQEDTE